MNLARKQKLMWVGFVFLGISIAISLTLYALRQNINLFYTPSQVLQGDIPRGTAFRVGGLVVKNSLHRGKKLQVSFILTDTANYITVQYNGILPDLFREGQGIVAQGQLNNNGEFIASEVLAKHDEKYMPPEVRSAIEQAKSGKVKTT